MFYVNRTLRGGRTGQIGTKLIVFIFFFYSNCRCPSAVCLSFTFFALFRVVWWPSAGNVRMSCLTQHAVYNVCVLFPYGD